MNEQSTDPWKKKDKWVRDGKGFCVEVYYYTEDVSPSGCYDSDGGNRWNVYAYIYPSHPHFKNFDLKDNKMWQSAATILPFHGYPSLCEYPMYNGKITCVKVGSDYNHLHDKYFTQISTREEASSVFSDAEELFEWLTLKGTFKGEIDSD